MELRIAEFAEWEKAAIGNGEYESGFDVWTLVYERHEESANVAGPQ